MIKFKIVYLYLKTIYILMFCWKDLENDKLRKNMGDYVKADSKRRLLKQHISLVLSTDVLWGLSYLKRGLFVLPYFAYLFSKLSLYIKVTFALLISFEKTSISYLKVNLVDSLRFNTPFLLCIQEKLVFLRIYQ